MSRRLTLEYVKERIERVPEYKLISTEYIDNHTNLYVKHTKCGTIYPVTFNRFNDAKSRCPECHPSTKLTLEYVKKYIESFPEYKLISTEYINIDEYLQVKHTKCGTIYKVTFHAFK